MTWMNLNFFWYSSVLTSISSESYLWNLVTIRQNDSVYSVFRLEKLSFFPLSLISLKRCFNLFTYVFFPSFGSFKLVNLSF